MSEIKVNSIKGVGASAAAISINNSDGTCTANLSNRQGKNLIVNGAMQVAQRGTSSQFTGYYTVDRFATSAGGTDEAPTQAQVDLSSSDTPYSLGFRKAFKLTNGNQTSGAGASDYGILTYSTEAQDVANSGWNYTDTNSKLTIQFWAKSSVAKTFILSLYTQDGTDYAYNHKYALAANTWTKITHTFIGNPNLTFDNDNGLGIQFQWIMFNGTTYSSGSTVDQWVVHNGYTSTPDDTSDWWTTNDATFEITGVQLEVGSVATDFEHLSFADELRRCQRYFHKSGDIGTPQEWFPGVATYCQYGSVPAKCLDADQDRAFHEGHFPTLMRDQPTLVFYPARDGVANTAGNISKYNGDIIVGLNTQPSAGCQRMIGYFATDTTHPAFTFQYTANAEL